jgi:hypothetical protein
MELPIRIMMVLFVALIAAGAIIMFATNTIRSAERDLADLEKHPPDKIIDKGDAGIFVSELVSLAEECYKEHTMQTVERQFCYVLRGNLRTTSSEVISILSGKNIPNQVESFSQGPGSLWIYYKPYDDVVQILTKGVGWTPPAPDCWNMGYQCCDTCQSGPHTEYDSTCTSPQVCCDACQFTPPPGPATTCTGSNFQCCTSCQSGPHPLLDSTCWTGQVCCQTCATTPPPTENLVMIPSNYNPPQNTDITIQVKVQNVNALYAIAFAITYDETYLNYKSGSFTDGPALTCIGMAITEEPGRLRGLACVDLATPNGFTGTDTLLTLTFTTTSQTGPTTLNFEGTEASDPGSNIITLSQNNPTITTT